MAMNEAPALANEKAIARPRPRDAPLMKTHFSERSDLRGSMSGYVSLWIGVVR